MAQSKSTQAARSVKKTKTTGSHQQANKTANKTAKAVKSVKNCK